MARIYIHVTVRRKLEGHARVVAFPETSVALPDVSGTTEMGARRHFDAHAGRLDAPVAPMALPVPSTGIKESVRLEACIGTHVGGVNLYGCRSTRQGQKEQEKRDLDRIGKGVDDVKKIFEHWLLTPWSCAVARRTRLHATGRTAIN